MIEDDSDVRALAVRLSEDLGYRVFPVPEVAAARKVLKSRGTVDLALSDLVLPGGVSGPEFAEAARRDYPSLKIIFMPGYPAIAAKRNGFLGSDSVLLNKPFQRRQLAQSIRSALGLDPGLQPYPNLPLRGNPLGGSLPAWARLPIQSVKRCSRRVRSAPRDQVRPSSRRKLLTSARPPSL